MSFDEKIDYDTATPYDIKKVDDDLIKYLKKKGEKVAVDRLDRLIKADKKNKQPRVDPFTKRLLKVNSEILKTLKDLERRPKQKQNIAIKHAASIKGVKNLPIEGTQEASDLMASGLSHNGMNTPRLKIPRVRRDEKRARRVGRYIKKTAKFLKKKAIPIIAVTASTGYIAHGLWEDQMKAAKSKTQAGRDTARTREGTGLAGAAAGGIAGGEAGAFIGSIIPGLGTVAGAVTGAAAGAALGFFLGDGVGKYIAEMWEGPLKKIPDTERQNPFILHSYLIGNYIPQLKQALKVSNNPKHTKTLEKSIKDYTKIAEHVLSKKNIAEWMETKIKDNNLGKASWQIKRSYLDNLMLKFKKTNYYNIGMNVIPDVAKPESGWDKGLADVARWFSGSHKINEKKQLKKAEALTKFNETNKLGPDGKALSLSENGGKNVKLLRDVGILEPADAGFYNSITDKGIKELKEVPNDVLQSLVDSGDLTDKARAQVMRIMGEKESFAHTSKGTTFSAVKTQAKESGVQSLPKSTIQAKKIKDNKQKNKSSVAGKPVVTGDTGKAPIADIKVAGKGYNVVQRKDGSIESRKGVRNWRNNNPGNIDYGEFSKNMGAVGTDGRFAVFPTYEQGRKAQKKLLFEDDSYKNLYLSQAIEKYAPPDENDTRMYVDSVLSSVDNTNKKMYQYNSSQQNKILDSMQRVEGYKVGNTQKISGATHGVSQSGEKSTTGVKSTVVTDQSLKTVKQEIQEGQNVEANKTIKENQTYNDSKKLTNSFKSMAKAGSEMVNNISSSINSVENTVENELPRLLDAFGG